ncbi:hypothetical protein EGW08_004834, partial [Elysia chlorotica]
LLNFLLKQILLVEEEDDRGFCEPLVVADGVKQLHTLHHTEHYHFLIFCQGQVIFTHSYNKYNGCDALKTMDPFLPLRSLATNIKHPE